MFAESILPNFPETPNDVIVEILVEVSSLTRRMFALTSRENLKLVPRILREFAPKRFTRLGDPRKYSIAGYSDIYRKYVYARADTILFGSVPAYFLTHKGSDDPHVEPSSRAYIEACSKYDWPIPKSLYYSGRAHKIATLRGNAEYFYRHTDRPPQICAGLLSGNFLDTHWWHIALDLEDFRYMVKYPALVDLVEALHGKLDQLDFFHLCRESSEQNDTRAIEMLLSRGLRTGHFGAHSTVLLSPRVIRLLLDNGMFYPGDAEQSASCVHKLFLAGEPMPKIDFSVMQHISDGGDWYDDLDPDTRRWFLDEYYRAYPEDLIDQARWYPELASIAREFGCACADILEESIAGAFP